jgi:alpha-mannosidase
MLKVGGESSEMETDISPQRKWTIYLFHHSHTDIGYTELQTRIAKKHAEYLDSVIKYCQATAAYPEESRFKWNIEVSWALENYMKERPAAKAQELLDLIKAGRVELSGLYLQLSDLFAHEELVRSVYLARELARKNAFSVLCAMNNDVTGFSWAIPQIFRSAGIRYFATGINETRSRAPLARPCAFYWESPEGSRILHWNGEHYLFANYELRIHEGYEKSFPKIKEYLAKLEARGDYPYSAIAFNISGYVTDNCPPSQELCDKVREWNGRWAYPRLRLATMREFFDHMEKTYGKSLPVYRLGWPDYWTDGVASTAYETGLNRLAHNDLLSAEKMAALAGATDKNYAYPKAEIDQAYSQTMLYDEHTWGAWNSISEPESELARGQWTLKSSHAYIARELAHTVLQKGLEGISKNIANRRPYAFAVFNPLSWMRSDVVKVALPEPLRDKKGQFMLIDARSGEETIYQLSDQNTILFLARNIPSLGYAVFSLQPDQAPSAAQSQMNFKPNSLENKFYRINIDPISGGIFSLLDKEQNLELVDKQANYTLNQYIYENPEGGRKAVDDMEKRAKFQRFSPIAAQSVPGFQGPVALSLVVKSQARPCPEISQEIILYNDIKRIDFVNTLNKQETYEPEALYFAFPFSLKNSGFLFEIADAAMRPEVDQLPGTTRDWQTVQHWVEAANLESAVVWSPVEAPLVQFGDINTGKWLKKLELANSSVFSYAINNYWMTNFKASQGGKLVFRYALTSRLGGSDPAAAARFGWEVHTALLALWLPEKGGGSLPPTTMSFLNIDQPNVIIQAVKPAEDRSGLIVRLREVAGKDVQVRITTSLVQTENVKLALTNVVEDEEKSSIVPKDAIVVPLKAYGIQTVKLSESRPEPPPLPARKKR